MDVGQAFGLKWATGADGVFSLERLTYGHVKLPGWPRAVDPLSEPAHEKSRRSFTGFVEM